jgi:hypothetical protein
MNRVFLSSSLVALLTVPAMLFAQTPPVPKPFPQPGRQQQVAPPAQQKPDETRQAQGDEPSEAVLGVSVYPNAQFLTSYDAGRGQRYYLFGVDASFDQVVVFYRNLLKDKGERVFDEPPVHMFDTGRFREDSMAFPPSVTVKDYTWGGMEGYLNPKAGAQPQRFKTVIQIVPAPPGQSGR